MQPLHAGANAGNILNGVTDANAFSPLFLERIIRGVVTFLDVEILTFFWAWRIALPIVVAILFMILARLCLKRQMRLWSAPLCMAGAAAAFALLHLGEDISMGGFPLRYTTARIPTSIEIPFCLAMAWLFVRFLSVPALSRGVPLAVATIALLYLRPYIAVPWGVMFAACLLLMAAQRQLAWRPALALLGLMAVAVLPLLALNGYNSSSVAYAEMMQRTFYLPYPYSIHHHWLRFLLIALALVLLGQHAGERFRPFFVSAAIALTILPLICGLFLFAAEMLGSDRFAGFYLTILLTALLLVFRQYAESWRGCSGLRRARWYSAGFCALGLSAAAQVGQNSLEHEYNFRHSPYAYTLGDLRFVPAYQWIRQNTPPESFFLVDDGIDWAQMPLDHKFLHEFYRRIIWNEDLFQIVARRRKFWSDKQQFDLISDQELLEVYLLQQGTFGLAVRPEQYRRLFAELKPTHILWRKGTPGTPPIPRGGALVLNCTEIYSDAESAVWRIDGLK
ncbi:MAG TPA: hypothetical protein VGP72_04705 [Planctomycetota bacterium]